MDIKFKGSIILIVLIAALYYTFPTYRAYQPGVDPQTVSDKVNLGLDLQGGMYLDIEIKAEEAVKEIIRRTAVELEDLMIDEQVDFVEVRQTTGSLIVEMETCKKVTGLWTVTRNGPRILPSSVIWLVEMYISTCWLPRGLSDAQRRVRTTHWVYRGDGGGRCPPRARTRRLARHLCRRHRSESDIF